MSASFSQPIKQSKGEYCVSHNPNFVKLPPYIIVLLYRQEKLASLWYMHVPAVPVFSWPVHSCSYLAFTSVNKRRFSVQITTNNNMYKSCFKLIG